MTKTAEPMALVQLTLTREEWQVIDSITMLGIAEMNKLMMPMGMTATLDPFIRGSLLHSLMRIEPAIRKSALDKFMTLSAATADK